MKKIIYLTLGSIILQGYFAHADFNNEYFNKNDTNVENQKKEENIVNQFMKCPNKKLIAAVICFVSGYVMPHKRVTRGMPVLGILGNVFYAAGGLLSLAWLYEKYNEFMIGVDLMYNLKENIQGWCDEISMLRGSIVDFKEKHRELQSKVNRMVEITDELQQGIKNVNALSGDQAHLAQILKEVLAQGKKDHQTMLKTIEVVKLIAQKSNINLDDEVLIIEKPVVILSEQDQIVRILEIYNKHGFFANMFGNKHRAVHLKDIPAQWFVKHDAELKAAGLFVRP
jgi:hypothetical protein